MIEINALHIELTNKCMLKCPRCARTTFIEKFKQKNWINKDLDLNHLKNFLDIDLENKKIILNGNYGDPIYHSNFFDVVKFFKEKKSIVEVTTNGSYKSIEWWKEFVSLLDARDTVRFSIDGTPDNFTKYRINADWKTIKIGLEAVGNSNVNSVWKFIPFSYNENSLIEAKQIAFNYNIKEFSVTKSDRFENDDWLRPSTELLGKRDHSIIQWRQGIDRSKLDVDPQCKNGSHHFITADGFYLPCCYVGDWRFYYQSKWYKDKQLYNIEHTTLTKLLVQEQVFFDTLEKTKHSYCTFNCPKI